MLNPGPEYVVRAYLTAWADQDIEQALTYLSNDVQWDMYLGQEIVTFAGSSAGVDAVRQRMNDLRASFELISFAFENLSLIGQEARAMIYANYRHIATGQVLDLAIRQVFTVVGKQIVRSGEYHDEERIRAFMALVDAENEAKSKPGSDG